MIMRKLLIAFSVFSLVSLSVFAKEYNGSTKFITLGLNFPNGTYDVEKIEDIKFNGASLALGSYTLLDDVNCFLHWGVNIGSATDKDDSYLSGIGLGMFGNVGYAFVNNGKSILSLAGLLAWDYQNFSKKTTVIGNSGSDSIEETLDAVSISIGAELFGSVKLTRRLGLYGSCRVQTSMFGIGDYRYKENGQTTYPTDDSLKLNRFFQVVPTIGLTFYTAQR